MIASYGSWPSPLRASDVAAAQKTVDAVCATHRAVYWLESRPATTGAVVVRRSWESPDAQDLTPPGIGVGSRVHEYGGGAYVVAEPDVFYVDDDDQRLYRMGADGRTQLVTPSVDRPGTVRHADVRVVPDRALLVCVRERHTPGTVVNELVAVPADGSSPPWLLAGGRDFYSFPRPSRDGRQLAWTCWDHPGMPWDGTELWVGDLRSDGTLGSTRRVAGGPDESVFQPEWGPDGELYAVSDRSGWWNLYRYDGTDLRPLHPVTAEPRSTVQFL